MRHANRLQHFIDQGSLKAVPTRWQVFQGELAMWAYVISPDVTAEEDYAGAPLGHPLMRQPIILSEVGLQHFNVGTGLALSVHSLCRHLQFTQHQGMPVWDLQLLHSHPGGLDALEASCEVLLHPSTSEARWTRRKLDWVVPNADAYLAQFLGSDGWIARARRYDYRPDVENPRMPAEYVSLTAFLNDCARFPERPSDLPLPTWPGRLSHQFTRRWREAGGLWVSH